MVEFAIVLPFLLLITFGVLELGVILIEDITLNKSAREASRYVASQWNLPGCFTNVASKIVETNMSDIFTGSTFNDFDSSTDSVTIEQICVDETQGTGLTGVGPTTAVDAVCFGDNTLCSASPDSHRYVRTTAVFQHKQLLPNLQIGQWQINYAPTLRAESTMRILN
ncbi:MAG: TadE/TadG family type IV pilus assembly protein [Gammaproteobacteria bacterium]